MLDTKVRVTATKCIALGTLDTAVLTAREVFRPAIQHSASSIITAHNHPSGDPTPSQEDIAMAKRLTEAGELIGITHLDHLVIGDDTFHSLRQLGYI
jgi:DNA repair protein RadC